MDTHTKVKSNLKYQGMKQAAKWFVKNLKDLISETMKQYVNYKLVLIGHSLGAGVASLVAIDFIESFPNLECICFATPQVLSLDLAKDSQNYITSFIFNDDFVPRLSIKSFKILRKKVLNSDWKDKFKNDMDESETGIFQMIKKYGKIKDYLIKKVEEINDDNDNDDILELYPAGKIYHLRNIDDIVYLNQCTQLDFEELIFSGTWLSDHFASNMFDAFHDLISQELIELKSLKKSILPPLPLKLLKKPKHKIPIFKK
jgi:pimeloyl-ACP methyl ester carboxylesterase